MERPIEWFRDQVIFLTGGTGNLGVCLLHKLALQLPTKKIFVLCRGSVQRALDKLEAALAEQLDDVLDTHRVQFMVGDTSKPSLGLRPSDLRELQEEVTVVINAAADISLQQPLHLSIHPNCIAHLQLLSLLREFSHLKTFLHVSTTSVNSFLPDGIIEERLYPLSDEDPDPEKVLSQILSTGQSAYTDNFIAPYAFCKHLAERLILKQADLPFNRLIVRPSLIGPAIRDPYPFYGNDEGMPLQSAIYNLATDPDYGLDELGKGINLDAIFDEIPVDLVANTCLAHLAAGSVGIVQAAGSLYVAATTGEITATMIQGAAPTGIEKVRRGEIRQSQNLAPMFFQVARKYMRNWDIRCDRSEHLKEEAGVLGLSLDGHDPKAFMKHRWQNVSNLLFGLSGI
ncbi:putative PKS/NRPS-like protein biosynthetic cluster [Aspergillus tubingensis]|uniref:Fatty acyl-CoA reductase n=1 Tax=Aspergillus tubingensis TaxID=5068 RepID=A0A8H3T4Y4_ASPTU|nr:thioester reductase family protein [Aspergillus tubingensis]GFN21579.1 thioester reductase family protein [Aspergillus tubingensis]GLA63786.1 putative PKS/NRPS-like protein biosynthetic cluster [Aspergillus tubingensis]GLA89664.1 putative PKS/NRPS-like protein biosynthetic cluster [Aspergillus tubingensis]